MEHIKLQAILWVVTSLDLLGKLNNVDKESILSFVKSCYNLDGGYGPAPSFSSSLICTLSALQVLIITFFKKFIKILIVLDNFEQVDIDATSNYVLSLKQDDGSFIGDTYGKII